MRLLLDENLDSAELMARLRQAGHHVETREKGTLDAEVWAYAQQHALAVLTANPPDFETLATGRDDHHGLLLVYGDRNPVKQMPTAEIARAIAFVEEVHGAGLQGLRVNLNEWRR